MIQLTWWAEYGPRIILVGVCLSILGRGASRTCERTMAKTAKAFWELSAKEQARKRVSYEASQKEVSKMWQRARKVEAGALYGTCGLLALFCTRQGIEGTNLSSGTQWGIALATSVVVVAVIGVCERRGARVRRHGVHGNTALEKPVH